MLSLLTVLVLTQSAPVESQCKKDDDCLISTLECCAGCCGPTPYATTRTAAEQLVKHCAELKCAKAASCDVVCEPPASPDAFRAKCVAHQCRMVAR